MAAEVALQVAVRCRPFSEDDAKLGVFCDETGDQQVVIPRPFDTFRAKAFNHCWWSAFNYETHLASEDTDNLSRTRFRIQSQMVSCKLAQLLHV